MALSFNGYADLGYIYTSDGGSFSANLKNEIAFDYFPDDAAVNDAIYFGKYEGQNSGFNYFRNIRVYIGTAFAATSVTFAWEYYTGSSWAVLTVTDGTSGWTAAGQQVVSFTPPPTWSRTTVNGVNAVWIRCRITAIDTPTEGGANSTEKCQGGDNTILATAYPSGSELSMATIYAADVAGSWGVVERYGTANYFYLVKCYLLLGDGTAGNEAILKCISQNITFGSKVGIALGQSASKVILGNSSNSRTGSILSFNKEGSYPSSTIWGSGAFEMYGSVLKIDTSYIFSEMAASGGVTIKDSLVTVSQGGLFGINPPSSNFVIDNSDFFNYRQFFNVTGAPSLNNVRMKDGTFDSRTSSYIYNLNCNILQFTFNSSTLIANFVSPTFNSIVGWKYGSGQCRMNLRQQLDLKVIDTDGNAISGASIVIKDNTDSVFYSGTTDANGDMTTQYPIQTYYERTISGEGTPDVQITYTPHTITISKTGYQTKTMVLTMDRKREEVVVLEKQVGTIIAKGRVAVNTDPTNSASEVFV